MNIYQKVMLEKKKKKKKAFKFVSRIEISKTDKGSVAKHLPANAGDMGSIPELR